MAATEAVQAVQEEVEEAVEVQEAEAEAEAEVEVEVEKVEEEAEEKEEEEEMEVGVGATMDEAPARGSGGVGGARGGGVRIPSRLTPRETPSSPPPARNDLAGELAERRHIIIRRTTTLGRAYQR
jgi:hypothetical protein